MRLYYYENLEDFQEIAGQGIVTTYRGDKVLVGNRTLLNNAGIDVPEVKQVGTIVYLAIEGAFVGAIYLNDTIKPHARMLVEKAKKQHIKLVMLTGDRFAAAQEVATEIGLESFHAELLPDGKMARLEATLKAEEGATAFVGDGINDAPSIIRADVGIAMGGIGSDLAVENADVVIMNDDPLRVLDAIEIAKATRKKATLNIIIALIVKVAVLGLSAVGFAPMWLAVLADTGLSLLLVLHSLMLIRHKVNH